MAQERQQQRRREASFEAALEALNFGRVLELVAEGAATRYGRDRVLQLRPGQRSGEELAREFERVDQVLGLLQRGEALPFGGVRDLGDSLVRARTEGTALEPRALLDIASTVAGANRLRQTIVKRREALESLLFYADFIAEMGLLSEQIGKKIDEKEGEVADDASPELRRIRREIASTMKRSRTRLDQLVARHSGEGNLLETNYTVRDGRFVLPVKAQRRGKVPGIVHGTSASGNTAYVEPTDLVELANELRRLGDEEAQEVRRILVELTDLVRESLHELEALVDGVGLLDSVQARAKAAEAWGAMRPRVRSGELTLVQARHPLLVARKGLEGAVPLDLALGGEEQARALVITGPNAGGKTVALKTVGLAAALIHSALWPPAGDGTTVPPLDELHVVIGDDQSLEGDLSSFSGHLEKLRAITDGAGAGKLVLVDEIAAGTDPSEGGALAMALLERAIERGWWTVVTTHMGQLKAFAHRTEGVRNGSMQFDREALTPTYRFQPDIPGSSYALEIAGRVGLPRQVVARARELAGEERMRLEDLIEELSGRLAEVQNRERRLALAESETKGVEKMLRERLERLEARRAQEMDKAAREAEEILAEANRTIELTVKELREEQASKESIKRAHDRLKQQKQAVEKARREAKKARRKAPKRIEEEKPSARASGRGGKPAQEEEEESLEGPVRVGDRVRVDGGQEGEVTALQGAKAQVAVGAVKLWMGVDRLEKIRRTPAPTGRGAASVNLHLTEPEEEMAPVRTELKLLGKRYEEAETELEAYLERLSLTGLKRARIVHGKGTGTLRAMVHEKLEQHPLVASWRLGEAGEGGDGVTVVFLNQ